MFSKVNIVLASLLMVLSFSSFSQSNSGNSQISTISSVNGTSSPAKEKKVKPAENKIAGSNVKEVNKKKRKSAHVTKVKKDFGSATKKVDK